MPTAEATAAIDSVECTSRCRARSKRRRLMWAITVVPVAEWKSRVKWLWDKPTAAAISGAVIGLGRRSST